MMASSGGQTPGLVSVMLENSLTGATRCRCRRQPELVDQRGASRAMPSALDRVHRSCTALQAPTGGFPRVLPQQTTTEPWTRGLPRSAVWQTWYFRGSYWPYPWSAVPGHVRYEETEQWTAAWWLCLCEPTAVWCPRNSHRNFRNSLEFPPGIQHITIPGNNRFAPSPSLAMGPRFCAFSIISIQ